MLNNSIYNASVKLQLKTSEVKMLVYGVRDYQDNPNLRFSHNARWALEQDEPLLTWHGAKIYSLGGGWWKIIGYGYKVSAKLNGKEGVLPVDVRDDLRLLGFAV